MPNWCTNTLVIAGNKDKVTAILDKINNGDGFFEKWLPTPKELMDEGSPITDQSKADEFKAKYGSPDWYWWRVNNWGTKWDIREFDILEDDVEDDVRKVVLLFDTAWAPPEIGIRRISGFEKDILFFMNFVEEGMCFEGYSSCMNGVELGSETVESYPKWHNVVSDVNYYIDDAKTIVGSFSDEESDE